MVSPEPGHLASPSALPKDGHPLLVHQGFFPTHYYYRTAVQPQSSLTLQVKITKKERNKN